MEPLARKPLKSGTISSGVGVSQRHPGARLGPQAPRRPQAAESVCRESLGAAASPENISPEAPSPATPPGPGAEVTEARCATPLSDGWGGADGDH